MIRHSSFALAIAVVVTAVPVSGQGVQLALVGGPSWATYHADFDTVDPRPFRSRLGRTGGAALRLDLTPVWAVELGALYVEKGFNKDPNYWMQVDYLEAPVLVRARLPFLPGPVWPVLHAGVAPAREIRSRQAYTPMPSNGLFPSWLPNRSWDLAAAGGAGLAVERDRLRLLVEARYSRGLLDLYPNRLPGHVRNRTSSLLMNVAFPVF